MTWFQKLSSKATKLFNKSGANNPNFLRKVGNTARKTDNSIARVGNFLANTAHSMGYNDVGDTINSVTNKIHDLRNNLEKAIKTPIGDVRHYA